MMLVASVLRIVSLVALTLATVPLASGRARLHSETRARLLSAPAVGSGVVDALEAAERVAVIVAFDVPAFVPTPRSVDDFDKDVWDAAIEIEGDRILRGLTADDLEIRHRYRSARAFAGTVTAAGLLKLAADPAVWRVDEDRVMEATLAQAVPFTGLAAVQALPFTGAGVRVAVLDTGIDATHPDLSDDLVGEQCFCDLGGSGCCPNGGTQQSGPGSARDLLGHGTWVSSIITGRGLVAPRGGAPDAEILAVKVLSNTGSGSDSGILAALDWILNTRPDVRAINMSLGRDDFTFDADCDDSDATTRAFADVIDALRVVRKVPVFAATGNRGWIYWMALPACVRNAIAVAASYDDDPAAPGASGCASPTPRPDAMWCSSNVNSRTDVVAPGVHVTTAGLGGSVSTANGTSFAAPLATACAAALLEVAPLLTPAQIEAALESAPRILDERTRLAYPPDGLRFPRLNCLDALMQVLPGTGLCPTTPRSGCRRPTAAGAAGLYLRKGLVDPRKDYLKWKWGKGAFTAEAAFGNPELTTSFSLCLYHQASTPLRMNMFAPAGGTCAGKPCWRRRSLGGWYYRDKLLSPSGIAKLTLAPGEAGRALIMAFGKGPNMLAPVPPLAPPVHVQLINHSNNVCWEATFSAPSKNGGSSTLVRYFSSKGE